MSKYSCDPSVVCNICGRPPGSAEPLDNKCTYRKCKGHYILKIERTCTHDLAERETMCADGYCPACLKAELDVARTRVQELTEKLALVRGELMSQGADVGDIDAVLVNGGASTAIAKFGNVCPANPIATAGHEPMPLPKWLHGTGWFTIWADRDSKREGVDFHICKYCGSVFAIAK